MVKLSCNDARSSSLASYTQSLSEHSCLYNNSSASSTNTAQWHYI